MIIYMIIRKIRNQYKIIKFLTGILIRLFDIDII